MSVAQVKALLVTKFPAKHVGALLKHYDEATEKFSIDEWDGVALKVGKFVEAVTKSLVLYCGRTLPANARHFSAGQELRRLEQQVDQSYGDVVRLVIPKACLFMYEVVNNRGGRHDPGEIDANEMDAKVIVPMMQWVLAELVRFCSVGKDTSAAANLIDGITNKVYPAFEDLDGRTYVTGAGHSAPDVGLLLLHQKYPGRISRKDLVQSIVRHGQSDASAKMAVTRMSGLLDDVNGNLKLRLHGRQKAAELLKTRKTS
jgi:hypothetical protein